MKRVEHDAIVEKKGQCFCLVPLGKIDIELRSRIQDKFLDGGVNATVSVQNAGNGSHAHLSGRCDFAKPDLSSFLRDHIFHLLFGSLKASPSCFCFLDNLRASLPQTTTMLPMTIKKTFT